MKGSARIIGSISGRAYVGANVTAKAVTFGVLTASRAITLRPITGEGERTRAVGLLHFLRVTPEQPQGLVWLVPQVGIDYTIETSTDLHWQIK